MMKNHIPKGAEYELRSVRTRSAAVEYQGNKFERVSSTDNAEQTLRLLHDGKISVVISSKPDSAEEMMRDAARMVKYGSPYDEKFAQKAEIKDLELYSDENLSSKEMIEKAGTLVADLRAADSNIVAGANFERTVTDTSLQTSLGFDSKYIKSNWSGGAYISYVQGDDKLDIWEYKMSSRPDICFAEIKDAILQKLEWAKNVVPFEAGAYPVIFTPSEVPNIINPIIASLNGKAVYEKVSPWIDKLGQVVLDERFTLIDDGSLKGAWTSRPFDLEGTPTRQNILVQNGRLQDILLNRKVAAQLGKESTGNGGATGPAPNFLTMPAGDKSFEDMIKSIDRGLIIDGTMGAWSGNPFAGIVTGTVSMGLKVEKGQIVGRVKDCMFTINAFEHFAKHLAGFSARRDYGWSFSGGPAFMPFVMLEEVVISTK